MLRLLFFCTAVFYLATAQAEQSPVVEPEALTVPALSEPELKVEEESPEKPSFPFIVPNYINRDYIETQRSQVAARVIRLSESLDSLFGDEKADDDRNSSTLRVSQRYLLRDGKVDVDSVEASLNLYLPNLKRAEQRFRDRFTPRRDSGGESMLVEDDSSEEQTFWQKELSQWSINPESGIRANIPLYYFGRIRARRNFLVAPFSNSFFGQIGWSTSDEWQQSASVTSDYAFSEKLLFRFENVQNWDMTFEKFTTSHGPSLLQKINDTSAISYDFRYSTEMIGYAFYSSRKALSSTYRRSLPIPWIYMSLSPEVAWEYKTGFTPIYTLYMKLEMIFAKDEKAYEL